MLFPKPAHKEKVKKGLNRYRKSPIARAKKKAWDTFSLYIRTKYSKDGIVECYTCGKVHPVKEMSAGHGIGGRNNAVLFLEAVIKPQCLGCNFWGRGQYRIFTKKLIDELGLEEYDRIVKLSNETIKYTTDDYLEIYELYKEKLSQFEVRSDNFNLGSPGLKIT